MTDPTSPPKPPSNKFFIDPMLKVLGRATGFKEGVYVQNKGLHADIVREAGYDPDNLEQYGKPEDGWNMWGQHPLPDGLARRIWYAHRECFDPRARKKGDPQLTTRGPKRGTWGLTKLGAETAKKLCNADDGDPSGGNATSKFLHKRLAETGGMDGTLYALMRSAVASKLPLSASIGIVDDHIQNCMMKLVARDALKSRLINGVRITDSHLATYAVRTGFTDIRRDGTEPVCREMYGARTERERAKGVEVGPLKDGRLSWDRDEKGSATISDVADTEAVDGDSVAEQMIFEDMWARIEAVVREKKPNACDRYVTILRRVVDGWTIKEIATAEDVSRHRAASLVSEARRCVREGRSEDLLAAVL